MSLLRKINQIRSRELGRKSRKLTRFSTEVAEGRSAHRPTQLWGRKSGTEKKKKDLPEGSDSGRQS